MTIEQLAQYVREHNLPATVTSDGSGIVTLNEYVAPDKTFHADPITVKATWADVREFLGY